MCDHKGISYKRISDRKKLNVWKQYGITALIVLLLLSGCAGNEITDEPDGGAGENISENITGDRAEDNADGQAEQADNQTETDNVRDNYDEVWYRTGVPTYKSAEIRIGNWKEGESFDVWLLTGYSYVSGGVLQGTAVFIDDNTAVLYDEEVEELIQIAETEVEDSGIYFEFSGDSIIVTHDPHITWVFGGGGFATAEGTYVRGEPEYTTCDDITEVFTESELEAIEELVGDSYVPLVKNMIEVGELETFTIEGGRLWQAYWMPYRTMYCNIIIYDNGDIYIEGYAYGADHREFYTNTGAEEMPDIEELKIYHYDRLREESKEAFQYIVDNLYADEEYSLIYRACDQAEYGYYDINYDGVDELVIQTVRGLHIYMYEDNAVREIIDSPYSVLLENGRVLYHRPGGAPMHDDYQIYYFDGDEYQWRCHLSRYDWNQNGYYEEDGEGDKYFYNTEWDPDTETEISKEEWEELMRPYLEQSEAVLHDTGVIVNPDPY